MQRFNHIVLVLLIMGAVSHIRSASDHGYQLTIIESSEQSMLCDIDFAHVCTAQIQLKSAWYTDITMAHCAYTDVQGLPKLPLTSLVLSIPSVGEPTLTIENENAVTQSIGEIVPVTDIQDDNAGAAPPDVLNDWYPGSSAEIGLVGFVRDQRILQIELRPVRYLASAKLLQIVKSLRLRIKFTGVQNSDYFSAARFAADDRFESIYKSCGNYQDGLKWRASPTKTTVAAAKIESQNFSAALKISVEGDGLYCVTGDDLRAAGVNLNEIDPVTLALKHRDQNVPMIVEGYADGSFNPDDRLIFRGEHNRGDDTYLSWYSDTNIYWLSWGSGPGVRYVNLIGSLDPAIDDTLKSARGHVHLEKDIIYSRFTYFGRQDKDHWFWETLNSGDSGYRFKISTAGYDKDGTFQIKVGMHGQTHPPGSPDHHALIDLNGQVIGDVKWDEQSPFEFCSNTLSNALLKELNEITITLPGDLPSASVDQVMLNYIDLVYDRHLDVQNDSLIVSIDNPLQQNYIAEGFQDDNIYILTENGYRVTNFTTNRKGDHYEVSFLNRSTVPTTFYLTSARRLKKVAGIEKRVPADLRNPAHGADYIVITHVDFMSQARKIANFRSGQGLRTAIVDIEDIYDVFNFGIYDPRAIKYFLQYAYRYWTRPAPMYILLIGDTTHKMDKKIARDNNLKSFVPTMMLYTNSWGMTSSDNYFVSVNGEDELPDMFIGRLPANSAEEANIMVQKTIDHETSSVISEWRRHVCMLTGTGEFFENSAQYLIDTYVPKSMVSDWVATQPTSPHFGSTEDVSKFINDGETIVNFIGHGGGGWFSDAGLFEVNDVERLQNKNRYAVTFSLTCFIGHFDNDELPSLAEVLLRAPDKGIVANFGSSGRAYLMGNYYLNNSLFEAIFQQNITQVGAITTWGKIGMVNQTSGYYDHVKNYNLLGDPATRLYFPSDGIDVHLSKNLLLDNDRLSVSGTIRDHQTGTAIVTAYNETDSLLVRKELPVQNGSFSCELFQLNPEIRRAWSENGGRGRVRVYFTEGRTDYASAAEFNVSIPFISAVTIEPQTPVHLDSVYFNIQLDSVNSIGFGGIKSVELEWSSNYKDWQRLAFVQSMPGMWRTQTPLVMVEGVRIYYKVIVTGNNNALIMSEEKNYTVIYRPDLSIATSSIGVSGTAETIIAATVKNSGDTNAGPFSVQAFEDSDLASVKAISPQLQIPGVPAHGDTTVSFSLEGSRPGVMRITYYVDDDNRVNESNEKNNRTDCALQIVTNAQGSAGPIYADNNSYYINIPANSLSKNTLMSLVELQGKEYVEAAQLSSLMPIRLRGASSWRTYQIQFADTTVAVQKPIQVAVYYNGADSLTNAFVEKKALKIYSWNTASSTWQGLASHIDQEQTFVSTELPPGSCIFSLLASGDVDGPTIRVSVEGQNFADGDPVSSRPIFTISVEDTSGFDFSGSPIALHLDGRKVDGDQYSIFHTSSSRRDATITYTADVVSDDHVLLIEATDLNGNIGSQQVSFDVAGEFELLTIANHPNPFELQTTIAFTLLDMAEQVDLNIYTVSGHLIRSMSFMDITGYNEWDWDGLDDEGNPIANGVYYLKIYAKKGDKNIQRIEKMAKLE